MGRRHVILVVVTIALGLLFVPAAPVFGRAPELLIPAVLAWAMAFLLAFRLAMGRSLVAEALAAAGLRRPARSQRTPVSALMMAWSLLLCASTLVATTAAVLWVRSYGVEDKVERMRWDVLGVTPSRWVRRLRDGWSVTSHRGVLAYERGREIILDPHYVVNKDIQVLPKPWTKFGWEEGPSAAAATFRPRLVTRSWLLQNLGIEYAYRRRPQRLSGDPVESNRSLAVPHRLIFAAAAALPMCALTLLLLRRNIVKPGHCPKCGYDLRATPGRCPECGEETPNEPSNDPTNEPTPPPSPAAPQTPAA